MGGWILVSKLDFCCYIIYCSCTNYACSDHAGSKILRCQLTKTFFSHKGPQLLWSGVTQKTVCFASFSRFISFEVGQISEVLSSLEHRTIIFLSNKMYSSYFESIVSVDLLQLNFVFTLCMNHMKNRVPWCYL